MDAGDVFEGLWEMARLRRSSAPRGELGSIVVVEIRFQEPERDATGTWRHGDELRQMALAMICCDLDQASGLGGGV
jgi:hypothetical protein